MNTTWQEFSQRYSLDSKYGFLFAPQYKVKSFDFDTLLDVTTQVQQKESDQELSEIIAQFPDLKMKPPHSQADLLILHDFTVLIINVYLAKKRSMNIDEQGIKIPKNLAKALYTSANQLGLHYGIGASISYNWIPITANYPKDNISFGLDDFTLKVYLTKNKQQEFLFFGGPTVASFYLAKMVKIIHEINHIIQERPMAYEQVKERLSLCVKYWQKITYENKKIVDHFSADYFNNQLRPKLRGYTNIVLEGVDNSKDLTISSPGGTAGFDPSFQMFELAFGIRSSGLYQKMQLNLRGGMTKIHVQCIKLLQQESLIRQYCSNCNGDVKEKYNSVVKAYGNFFRLHSEFMIRFILNPQKKMDYDAELSPEKGTAGTVIKQILLRYESIQSQILS